ncbi:MAG: response regulator [Polyangiaceae bacterium]|nr:response regulator [Polyangiaceae bacterium]
MPISTRPQPLTGLKVLFVDDNDDLRDTVCELLELFGAKAAGARDGAEGKRRALGGNFDVVLMDARMPGIDGLTATRALRAEGYQVPILALTANSGPEYREECLKAGCEGYLVKPIDHYRLIEALRPYLNQKK